MAAREHLLLAAPREGEPYLAGSSRRPGPQHRHGLSSWPDTASARMRALVLCSVPATVVGKALVRGDSVCMCVHVE